MIIQPRLNEISTRTFPHRSNSASKKQRPSPTRPPQKFSISKSNSINVQCFSPLRMKAFTYPIPKAESTKSCEIKPYSAKSDDFDELYGKNLDFNLNKTADFNKKPFRCVLQTRSEIIRINPKNDFDKVVPMPQIDHISFDSVLQLKLRICSFICNFSNSKAHEKEKKIKTAALNEILSIVSTPQSARSLNENQIVSISEMCLHNIVRNINPLSSNHLLIVGFTNIDDPAWPHLNLCYSIFRILCNTSGELGYFNVYLMEELVPLLSTGDEKERDILTTILNKFIQSHVSQSSILLSKFESMIEQRIENRESSYCVPPILKLTLDIFNLEFQPLNVLNRWGFYMKRLVADPLFARYEKQVREINIYLFEELPGYAGQLALSLISKWPRSNTDKEACFLRILNSLIPRLSHKDFANIGHRLLLVCSQCFLSTSTKVAEEALSMISSPEMETLPRKLIQNSVTQLYKNAFCVFHNHWSSKVREVALSAMRTISKVSPKLVQEFVNSKQTQSLKNTNTNNLPISGNKNIPFVSENVKMWSSIARFAAKNDNNLDLGEALSNIKFQLNSQETLGVNTCLSLNSNISSSQTRFRIC